MLAAPAEVSTDHRHRAWGAASGTGPFAIEANHEPQKVRRRREWDERQRTAQATATTTADWGFCARCDALTQRDPCAVCGRAEVLPSSPGAETPGPLTHPAFAECEPFSLERLPELARLRPSMVHPFSDADLDPDLAAWLNETGGGYMPVPDDATPAARRVASTLAIIASRRLAAGDSTQFALTIAAGRDFIHRELEAMGRGAGLDLLRVYAIVRLLGDLLHVAIDDRRDDGKGVKNPSFTQPLDD
jgi:hypothetical protein